MSSSNPAASAYRRVSVAGCPGFEFGSQGLPILLVAGPPTSAALFRRVQARLAPRRSIALELIDASSSGALSELRPLLTEACVESEASLLLAHGSAVPLLFGAGAPVLPCVVSTGPMGRPDPLLSALARLGVRGLAETLLQPMLLQRWLSSSLGWRRAVVNPYVMHRDMVVLLTGPVLQSREHRLRAARWLVDTAATPGPTSEETSRMSAIWGDADRLYPLDRILRFLPAERVHVVPGARHLHPEERPWETADRLLELRISATTT